VSKFTEYWGKQFSFPHGLGGKIAVLIMNRINKKMNMAILKNVPSEGRVLDIGFGGGNTLKLLLKKKCVTLYGVDISADMLRAAAKRNRRAIKKTRLTLAEGAVDAIPFEGNFDCIYTSNTVYFWRDLGVGLATIREKLKASGTFLNVFRTKEWLDKLSYTEGYAKYELDELQKATEAAGFSTEVITIATGTYMLKATKTDRR